MDGMFGRVWRDSNTAQYGTPRWYVARSINSFELYPRPNYTTVCNDGIGVEGYFRPGVIWDPATFTDVTIDPYDNQSSQDLADNPLGSLADYAVIYGTVVKRMIDINNPGDETRYARYQSEYAELWGDVAAASKNQVAAIRQQTSGGHNGGPFQYWGP
jgi:hypothetical protein